MKMNNQDNEQKRSILMSPRLKLFCKIMLNVAIPMVILIYTMPYSNWGILLAFITACLLTFFLVNGIMHESSNELLTLNQWMNEVVSGQLETRQTQTNNKTIQGIFFSFQRLVNHLTLLRDVCMGISQGDYSKFFVEAPPFDSVGVAVEKLRQKVIESGIMAERHLNFLNHVPLSIIILKRNLELDYMNLAAEKMFQQPVSKCLGMPCKDLLNSDQCQTGDCKAFRAMETDMTLTTMTNIYVGKKVYPVRYTSVPIHDYDNQVIGVMKFIMDISSEMQLVDLAERISKGDYSINIDKVTEDKRLTTAINKMTQTLRKATKENEIQHWIKTGQTELNVRLRGEQDIQSLAENIIFFLCDYLNAPVGTFYTEKETKFKLVASYAYTHRQSFDNVFELGEGLIGQAALEKKIICFNELPPDYLHMQSGLGKKQPGAIIIVPLKYHNKVIGVMEFGAVQAFTQLQIDFLELVSENIAVAINTSKARTRMSTLLAHSQNQSEELKVQQEELQQAYEDLEEQTKRLQQSEASLQQQHEELRQSNKSLEEQAQMLEEQKEAISKKNETLERQQVIIEQKAKDLEIANQYKTEFLANMSHELRTPLNSILLLSGIIAEDKDNTVSEKHKEFANTINMCGTDLLNLIDEVLDLSKVESGKMEVYPEICYLQDIVSSLKKTFEQVAIQNGVAFNINILSEIPEQLYTDQQRLEQILKNILSNAFKFTKSGQVSLSIKRPEKAHVAYEKHRFEINDLILFEIKDTGPGIPVEKQKYVFEAFHQGDGTTKRQYGGTGLGLSIVKKMVHLLGGNVFLESDLGKGSTFSVVVPDTLPKEWSHVVDSLEPEPDKKETKPDVQTKKNDVDMDEKTKASHLKKQKQTVTKNKILIISKNATIAGQVKLIAEKQKFKPEIVQSSENALAICLEHIPEGIILDLGLPDWTCWFLYIHLQKMDRLQNIPVHWISGLHLESPDRQKRMFFLKKEGSKTDFTAAISSINALCENNIQTILIVCDKNSFLIKEFEIELHMTCIHQSDILEASKYIEINPVSALILDTSYKDMKGIQHIEQLSKIVRKAQIPALFITDADIWEQEWILPIMNQDGKIKQQTFNVMERMTDETLLFFHRLKKIHADTEKNHTQLSHNKDEVLKGKKILLVDDDMRNVFAISSVLEARGSTVIVGRNGKEGMKCLSDHPDIDLILMDIMMPEMDGYEAITTIREKSEYKKLPIIALTAKAMKKDRDKCIQVGADDYMPKPVYPDKLIAMLRLWLNK
jgi:signal transduction histidine kinase/DNA-binding response OmpR family regulator/PAS domain-containing protein